MILLAQGKTVIGINERYRKKSTRNRAYIQDPNEIQRLTVPVQGGKTLSTTKEALISKDSNWSAKHLQALKTAYQNTPYYIYYIDEITHLIQSDVKLLVDLNRRILEWITERFGIECSIGHELTDDDRNYLLRGTYGFILPEQDYPWISDNLDLSILHYVFTLGPELKTYLNQIEIQDNI